MPRRNLYTDPSQFDPEPCPACGAPQIVTKHTTTRVGDQIFFLMEKTDCSVQCWRNSLR